MIYSDNYCVKSLEDNNIKYDIIKVHQLYNPNIVIN
jgi:hypothetical protein